MQNGVLFGLRKQNYRPGTVFDVGANIGQSTLEFRRQFPETTIVAFEPIQAAYDALKAAVGPDAKTTLHRAALGKRRGDIEMVSYGASPGNHIVGAGDAKAPKETVPIWLGDEYCRENGIEFIDFLKIDTEGHDLDVLLGFREMMANGNIEYIQVECGVSPENVYHITYDMCSNFLFGFGYRLHGLFDLVTKMRKVGVRRGALYGNAVFIREG